MTVAAGRLEVETPDHVVLRYDLAGAGNRGFAAVLDFLLASVIAFFQGRGLLVLLGGLLLGAVVPFTLIVMLPTNNRLLAPAFARESPEAAALLHRWGQLHAVRSVASALAFGLLVVHLARGG